MSKKYPNYYLLCHKKNESESALAPGKLLHEGCPSCCSFQNVSWRETLKQNALGQKTEPATALMLFPIHELTINK